MYKQYRLPIALAVLALIISTLALLIFHLTHTATLEVMVAPTSATVTINGKRYKNGTHKLVPGNYSATISGENFITQSADFTLSDGATSYLYIVLDPDEDHATWYEDHPEDYQLMSEIGAKANKRTRDDYYAQYPELQSLPQKYVEQQDGQLLIFRLDIDQSADCSQAFCLSITDFTGYSEAKAREILAEKGFDLNQIPVFYQYTPVEQAE